MTAILWLLAALGAVAFICGFLAAATGNNTPPPRYQRDPLDDELDALLDSEREL